MNRNWIIYFGIFLVLLCCTPSRVKSGGYGEYVERDTDRIFNRMMERRDIKMAINTLIGEGFTSSEIQDAVENRLVRIPGSHFPGNFCSASGKIGEPGEGTYVGPTYYLIIARARILKWFRQVGGNY
jgi:hypothetical protein